MMRILFFGTAVLYTVLGGAGCQLYPQWAGEFDAGPVDPVNFPAAYVGAGGDHTKAGSGVIAQLPAFSQDVLVGYYAFPFAPSVVAPTDPLLLVSAGVPATAMPTPQAYVFDPVPGASAFPAQPKCTPPKGYVYNSQRDDVHYDEQGNIFTALPSATYSLVKTASYTYEPIVSEVAVNADAETCQSLKSAATVGQALSAKASPDGYYLAWPIIDPAAAVYRLGESSSNATGTTVQHWGWYNHYLLAYLDGGYIPTSNAAAADGTPQVHMVTQKLFYPVSKIITPTPASGTQTCAVKNGGCAAAATCSADPTGAIFCTATGNIGQGYDVITAPRGDSGYSPVCQVFTYKAPATVAPAALPQDAAAIQDPAGQYAASITAAFTPYIYCLQVQ